VDRTKPAINRTRMNRITYYLKIADLAAERSTCHIKAGCVITRNNRITAIGYNGAPPGQDHCLDKGCLLYKGHCIRTVHCIEKAKFKKILVKLKLIKGLKVNGEDQAHSMTLIPEERDE